MSYTLDEQRQTWAEIDRLTDQNSLPALRQARQLLRDWMQRHPDDYASADAGEELAMLEEALEIIAQEQSVAPVAA